jgi:CBS domain-containing protein
VRVSSFYGVDLLGSMLVRDVMSRDVETIDARASVGEAAARLAEGPHSAYPVVKGGRVVSIVTRGDLLRYEGSRADPVSAVASTDVVTISPDRTLREGLRLIVEEGVEHLPVVAEGRLVGICTRTDIMRARRREFELERLQPGWRFPWRRRPPFQGVR